MLHDKKLDIKKKASRYMLIADFSGQIIRYPETLSDTPDEVKKKAATMRLSVGQIWIVETTRNKRVRRLR